MTDLILGYVFSYKDSEVVDGRLRVTFHRGVSRDYPREYTDRRDFSCESVHEGDVCHIAIDDDDLMAVFSHIQASQDIEALQEVWEAHYASIFTFDDYLAFDTVLQTGLEMYLRHIPRYSHRNVMAWAGIGENTYEAIREVVNARYEREIREALS